jgi:hypothetical protein
MLKRGPSSMSSFSQHKQSKNMKIKTTLEKVLRKERYERRERERDTPKREKQQILLQKCVLCKTFGPESTFPLHRFIKSWELWNCFGAVG